MFRPCIDLHKNKVKQIIGSSLKEDNPESLKTNFISSHSSEYYAKLYCSLNLYGGHIIMLDKKSRDSAILALHTFPQGFHIGGGMNMENASYYLEQGASHIIFSSYLFTNNNLDWDKIKKLKKKIGRHKIVFDLSCKRENDTYIIMLNRWQNYSNLKLNKENLGLLANYCDEFLIHSIDVEGKKEGMDRDLVKFLAGNSPIKSTYAGGINSLEEVEIIHKISLGKVDFTIGSGLSIFGGDLNMDEVIKLSSL